MREKAREKFSKLQSKIFDALVALDASVQTKDDAWKRGAKGGQGFDGGGGLTRIMFEGEVFERGGVNFSEVWGDLPAEMAKRLGGQEKPTPFYATGVSLVIHPRSPLVPTTHANVRYLEVGEEAWFGGGSDLTPYYLYEEDAKHFHQALKARCDLHDAEYYPRFKKWCDEYFFLPHRGEARGIGGIFFDYLGKGEKDKLEHYFSFTQDSGEAFLEAYLPIVEKRKDTEWSNRQKAFQLYRRGRYVEFNLLYDRGTVFGLKTGGRTESILMSLPPEVRFEYNWSPEVDSEEARVYEVIKEPVDWLSR